MNRASAAIGTCLLLGASVLSCATSTRPGERDATPRAATKEVCHADADCAPFFHCTSDHHCRCQFHSDCTATQQCRAGLCLPR